MLDIWVKNVNNLRAITGISSVYSSPRQLYKLNKLINYWVQPKVIHFDLLYYSTIIYTYLFSKFTLLNKSFTHYPHPLLMRLKR